MPNIIYALNMKFAQIFSVKQNWKCLWLFQAEERSPKDVEAPNAKYHTFNCHMVIMFWQVLLLLIFYLKWNIILLHCGYSSVLLFKKTVLYLLVNPGFLLLRYWNELWSHCSCCNPKTKIVLYILSNTGFVTASLQKWIPRMLWLAFEKFRFLRCGQTTWCYNMYFSRIRKSCHFCAPCQIIPSFYFNNICIYTCIINVHGSWRSAWHLQLVWHMAIFCRLV